MQRDTKPYDFEPLLLAYNDYHDEIKRNRSIEDSELLPYLLEIGRLQRTLPRDMLLIYFDAWESELLEAFLKKHSAYVFRGNLLCAIVGETSAPVNRDLVTQDGIALEKRIKKHKPVEEMIPWDCVTEKINPISSLKQELMLKDAPQSRDVFTKKLMTCMEKNDIPGIKYLLERYPGSVFLDRAVREQAEKRLLPPEQTPKPQAMLRKSSSVVRDCVTMFNALDASAKASSPEKRKESLQRSLT